MPVRVLVDSTCDLPESLARSCGVKVLPMAIQVGEKTYLDGVNLSRKEFYERLPEFQPYPTTSAAPLEHFCQAYEQLVQEGATEILSIHIASSLSKVTEVARLAASEFKQAKVTVFDSRQVSLGTGFLAETAARAAADGRSMTEILGLLEDQIKRTHVVAILDLLEYMQRSGRMSAVMSGLGKMLKFKPLIHIYDGSPNAESVRTHERASSRLVQVLEELGPLERIALLHSNAAERLEDFQKRAAYLLPKDDHLLAVDITPVLGVHTGPGAMGFACVVARRT